MFSQRRIHTAIAFILIVPLLSARRILRFQEQNINLEMVKHGMAWVYPQYVKNKIYFQAQDLAQQQKIGLWRDPNPTAPYEWRKQNKAGKHGE